jgi:hypothetical integral membrane protein (TIGR02206 family)
MRSFVLFGTAHLMTLAVIGLTAVLLSAWMRARFSSGSSMSVRCFVAAALAAFAAYQYYWSWSEGWLTLDLLPLHLCDVAVVLAVFALLTRNHAAAEVLYFWSGAGTSLALLTPDLAQDFPSREYFVFFALHGLVVVAAAMLTFGLRLKPRPGAVWRVFAITNVYAVFVAAVNALLRTNFLYLARKPPGATLLDYFGPWPIYIAVGELVAVALFHLLDLPFKREGRRSMRIPC